MRYAGLPGFEPGSEAPEASVISRLHHRPLFKRERCVAALLFLELGVAAFAA